jgi:hypothetical protein
MGGLLALTGLAYVTAMPARAFAVETPPWVPCFFNVQAASATLEHSLSPADGTTVQVGATVDFSGQSTVPLSYEIASSAAQLTNPNIASDPDSAQTPTSVDEPPIYTFSSAAVTQTPRTIYWEASFPESEIPECGGSSKTVTSAMRTLTVLPNHDPEPLTQSGGEQLACTVPQLRGDSLPRARKALTRADCHLGSVSQPDRNHRASLVVVHQNPQAGTHLTAAGTVAMTLKPRTRHGNDQ